MSRFQSTWWTLIQEASEGQEAALRDFVEQYRAPIVAAIARRGLGADAEDLAQEVLVRLVHQGVLTRADPDQGRFRHLVLAVTRHAIGTHLTRARAQKRGGGKVQTLGDIEVAAPSNDDEFDAEWVRHLIDTAFARLRTEHANYHDALRLFLLEDQPYTRIAETIGKPESDVKNHIFRGKRKLIEYIQAQVRDYSASGRQYEEEIRALSKLLPGE